MLSEGWWREHRTYPFIALRLMQQIPQKRPMPVIGILAVAAPDNAGAQRNLAAFRQGLAESGYVDGRNVAIEYRWASANYDRLPGLAARERPSRPNRRHR